MMKRLTSSLSLIFFLLVSVEHQLIKAHTSDLERTARKDNHAGIIAFIQDVNKHARIEEEIYFPAAILVGEYLKLRAS